LVIKGLGGKARTSLSVGPATSDLAGPGRPLGTSSGGSRGVMARIGHNITKCWPQHYYDSVCPFDDVFVRAKRVGRRRYLYLVEGKRDREKVRQKTICYLGPMSKLASGVPEAVRTRVDARLGVDWTKVNDQIARIPLSFEELSEARRAQFATSARTRGTRGRPTQGDLPRAEGELSALSRLAEYRFKELFEETGTLAYRMK
jgi:hypothetical protein